MDYYTSNAGQNDHWFATAINVCAGVSAGDHTLTVQVTNSGGGTDCYTGWSSDAGMQFYLEAQELEKGVFFESTR